jgi:hypothetical protein
LMMTRYRMKQNKMLRIHIQMTMKLKISMKMIYLKIRQ